MEGNLPYRPTGCHQSHKTLNLLYGWDSGLEGWERGVRNNTTHLHKQQAHTSLSPSGIHVDELFMLNRNQIMYDHG